MHQIFMAAILNFSFLCISYTKIECKSCRVACSSGLLGKNFAHLTTSMKFCTLIDFDLLNSNLPGAKADSQWGSRN